MYYFFFTIIFVSLSAHASYQSAFSASPVKGVRFVKEYKSSENRPSISYQKYQLDNGLTVILHPDKSDPLVHVDMTYHVGSAREEIGKSGFAHFFEHMMFQGSKHVGDQQHFKAVTESGGSVNGTTSRDCTNYYQTVPANELEKILWLESDRMGFLLEAVSQRKFEIQRDTVKNERAQNYENRPYGLVAETVAASLYPVQHPYSWPTIGYVEDLNRVGVDALKDFFLRWYGPNNATLTIGGDIDVTQTLKWVKKYFGDIPRGPEVKPAAKWPVTLESDRFVTIEDKIQQPMLLMSWPTQYPDAKSTLPLNMLASVLGQGRNSLLYQQLVKTGKVLNARAYQNCGELACEFQLYVIGHQGQSLKQLHLDVMNVLKSLKKRGIKQDDLDQVKGMAEADAVFSIQSVSGKVAQLAANETYFDEPERLADWLTSLNKVTTTEIEQAFYDYIWQKPSVVLSVVPKGQLAIQAKEANFKPITKSRVLNANNSSSLAEKKAATAMVARITPETFDRSVVPKAKAGVTIKVPKLYKATLDNNIEVLGSESKETPTISMHFILPAGSMMEPKGQNGLAALTASLLREGTHKQTSEQISSKLDKLGSMLSVDASTHGTTISISSLSKNISATLEIAADVLFNARFAQEDFDRLKKQTLEAIDMNNVMPNWLAGQARRQVMYQDMWNQSPPEGTKQSIKNITLDDVKAFYAANYTPDNARLIVVGDINKTQLLSKIDKLNQWKGPKSKKPALASLKQHDKPYIWLVDNPKAPQSVVQLVRHGMPYDATNEMFKTQLANFNLAGNFNSRLNMNLREDKGYTYGANGWVNGNENHGIIMFQAQVRADCTADSIKEMQSELGIIAQKGIQDDEIVFLRLAGEQKDALSYETPSDKARLIANIMRYQLAEDYKKQQKNIIQSIKKEELDHLAKKWFEPTDYQIIVVGDAKAIEAQLKKLGLPIKRLSLIV